MTYNYGLIINFRKTHCRCTILYYVTILLWNHILVNEKSRSLSTHFEKKVNFFFIFNPAVVHRQKNLFITFFFLHVRNPNFGSRLLCTLYAGRYFTGGGSLASTFFLRCIYGASEKKGNEKTHIIHIISYY